MENAAKTIIIIIVFIILIFGAGYIFFRDFRELETANAPGQNSNAELKVEDKKITDSTKPFKIDVAYPQVSGVDDFNKRVSDFINGQINDFKKNSLENDEAVKQTDPENYAKYPREYDLTIGYEKGEINQNIISVVFEVYSFTGGAHGATNFVSFNYNPSAKADGEREIKLADLFAGQQDYLQKISDYCIKDLTAQVTNKLGSTEGSWIKDGASPKADNFSVFLINKDNVILYFPQYQVAPGAAGNFQVKMPI